ncbi:AraC family transcriptional regulator [Nocardioides sp. SYSU D00038]|uniref:AraC family transcriptional regulator n=1 Tax=Nocardioides sp. SYSU D00038 TaxID=2812554 RepID=UPI0027DAC507|nr:AraC family transcriptional regulator [Nocardioides sp. SYSU D00038]
MITELNRVVDAVEDHLTTEAGDLDVAALARELATTEHHLRRMFAALAGIGLTEYVRRRRMTVAAGAVVAGQDDLLTIAVRHGYGSSEAFGRAFRAVHGAPPGDVRRDGGPLRTQQRIRFRLTVEGSTPMDARIVEKPAFTLVGRAARVPLIHSGVNPHIAEHVASVPVEETLLLKELSDQEPVGVLAVTDDLDPDDPADRAEGAMLTYLHGVATSRPAPDGFDVIEVPAHTWVVFRSEGPHPEALQQMWAATATDWFPSNPYRLVPGPELLSVLEFDDDWTRATCELWMPVEPA